MLLDIFLPPTPGVPCADKFGVVFEAGRNGLAAMRVPLRIIELLLYLGYNEITCLYKLDHLPFLFRGTPFLEGDKIGKDESIAIIGIARAIRLLRVRRGQRKRFVGIRLNWGLVECDG